MDEREDNEEMVTVAKTELQRLRSIEEAAKRFSDSGASVHQMSPRQWQAYTDLTALFHGGIQVRTF